MSRIFVCIELNEKTLNKALAKKCDKIIFVKQTFFPNKNVPLTIINANLFEAESYEKTYTFNKNLLEEFQKKCPDFFVYKDIPLLEAINKDLFWATRYEGMLNTAIAKLNNHKSEVIEYRRPFDNIKNLLKYLTVFLIYLRGILFPTPRLNAEKFSKAKNKTYAFYVADKFEWMYYHGLADVLGKDNCVFFANHIPNPKFSSEETERMNIITRGYKNFNSRFSFRTLWYGIKLFGINKFYLLLTIRQHIINTIEVNLKNLTSHLSAIFLVAQENTGFGNVTALMGKKFGIITVNSHNGVKTPYPYSRDNHFDIWCCWDEQMKILLHEKCFINQKQLVVTGHLMEDVARKHSYQNSFDGFYNPSSKNKIISLFSTNENPIGKWETINTLIQFVNSRNDLQLLIRLHPSEDKFEWNIFHNVSSNKIKIIFPVQDDRTQILLYDQLLISDVSVVFGSTVAIESTWFDVPCITMEAKEKSMLYAVDGKKIFHEKNANDLIIRIESLLRMKKEISHKKISVAQRIKEVVTEKINSQHKRDNF